MTTMVTSHTALSAVEDEKCSCVETTTVVGEVSTGLYWGSGRNVNHDSLRYVLKHRLSKKRKIQYVCVIVGNIIVCKKKLYNASLLF